MEYWKQIYKKTLKKRKGDRVFKERENGAEGGASQVDWKSSCNYAIPET